ncbi:ATP phosphoribosyltransferase regulatory subunit [Rhodovibrionaceae bacterium A322]
MSDATQKTTEDNTPKPAAALLPAGLADGLPPEAAHEAGVIEALIACFETQGYQRVKPPLVEFEETLLAGPGAQVAPQTFRLMDPVSQRMMGFRADTTPQVARIAASRLSRSPRPLRLCYAGQVLRVRGSQLRPERQFAQVGTELIGGQGPEADTEVSLLAVEALTAVGVKGLSIDFCLPTLVGSVCADLGLDAQTSEQLKDLLDRKDAAGVADICGDHKELFLGLLHTAGPAESALQKLDELPLPASAREAVAELKEVTRRVAQAQPDLAMTVDPVEHRGFEYQSGLSFTLFARNVRGELGRGGRYLSPGISGQEGEDAIGFTLYMDSLLRAAPAAQSKPRLFLPLGTDVARARDLRAQGWITVAALTAGGSVEEEARRLGCSHALINEEVSQLEG